MDSPQNELAEIRRLLADLVTRVDRIERRLRMEAQPQTPPRPAQEQNPSVSPAVKPESGEPAPAHPPVAASPPRPSAILPAQPDPDLESRIGSHWLNRIGIAALLVGISYFLKFAFENNWIGPAGRVAIGLIAGIAVVAWSERFRSKGYKAFSYSLKAVGFGTLYLSLWAAFQRYGLIPSGVAFAMMLVVTASAAAMALAQDAQILAAFALTGGFATPLLLSTGQNREVVLFAYVAILDLATLFLVRYKPWRRLLVMSYAGTLLLYIGWYLSFYSRSQLSVTLGFATLFFAIFAIAPLVTLQPEDENAIFASIPALLAFVNAAAYFLQAYAMIVDVDKTYMAWFALALAAIYILLSRQVHTRVTPGASEILHFLHLAVAIGFITVAIPIRLDAHWITIGWFVEAGVLVWVADRIRSDFLNLFALTAVALGVVRLLFVDDFYPMHLIFNLRVATYAVAIAVLAGVAWFGSKREDEAARMVAAVSLVAVNALALIALTREVAYYYSTQVGVLTSRVATTLSDYRRNEIARDFTYSALWMGYGAMLMIVGFVRRSAFVRWQALLLIAATVVKVFVYDVSQLDRGYRIVSFIVLGVLLLAISFVYQRDWLQLSAKSKAQPKAEGTSPSA